MRLDDIGFHTLTDERARNASVSSPLWRLCFLITGRCNFSCPYCNGLRCNDDMGFDFLKSILDDAAQNHDLRNVRFSGGEPTLHPRLLDMVKQARSCKSVDRIAISTNGFADFSLYESLVASGANDFSISCDSCDPQTVAELAGGIDVWTRVSSSLAALSKIASVMAGITVSEKNLHEVKDVVEKLDALGVSDMKLSTSTHFNGAIPGLEKISSEILDRHPVLKYRVTNFLAGRNVRGLRDGDCGKCMLVQDELIIMGDRHYPCIVHAREQAAAAIGNVKTVAEMRKERLAWALGRDSHLDMVCKKFCMDIFIDCNNRIEHFAKEREKA